jgi:hypothetical protein
MDRNERHLDEWLSHFHTFLMLSGKWEVVWDAGSSCNRHSPPDDHTHRSLHTGKAVKLRSLISRTRMSRVSFYGHPVIQSNSITTVLNILLIQEKRVYASVNSL